jgi:hypothetical protein
MDDNILDIGKMENNMDKLRLLLKTVLKEKVYGMMVKELDG